MSSGGGGAKELPSYTEEPPVRKHTGETLYHYGDTNMAMDPALSGMRKYYKIFKDISQEIRPE